MFRILLVEDHEALAALRYVILNRHGYDIMLARDGDEACRLLGRESFDLVITDAELPAGSGREVAATAKKRRLPVILTTGVSAARARSWKVDFVITKPSSVAEFLSIVQSALEKARAEPLANKSSAKFPPARVRRRTSRRTVLGYSHPSLQDS